MTVQSTVLAFDLGASSGRALLGEWKGDSGGKRLEVKEIHRFDNRAVEVGNHLHWDILHLLQEIKQGIRLAFQKDKPETFGIDTWGVDFGLIDQNGELIANPYHYRDPQTEGLIDELNHIFGAEYMFSNSGLQFMPFNTVYQLYAMKKAGSPKLDIARTLLLTPDLLTYLLTGRRICEYTMATTTQLLHPVRHEWNVELMDRIGIASGMFSDIMQPGQFIGPLTKRVSAELGVPRIQAVAVATHDTESAAAAVPAGEQPFAYIVSGTWSLLGTELDEPILSEEALAQQFSNEGGAGGKVQLLKNIMGLWILQECKRQWEAEQGMISYEELITLAEKTVPFRSLIHPDDPRFFSPSGMIQKVQDYCTDTKQPIPTTIGEVTRCILESLALRYRQVLEQAENLTGRKFPGLHIVGGGSQNVLLCQFTAEAIGRPVWAGPVEASAIGNMLLQLMALGHSANLREARELVRDSFPVDTYIPENEGIWIRQYERFNLLSS